MEDNKEPVKLFKSNVEINKPKPPTKPARKVKQRGYYEHLYKELMEQDLKDESLGNFNKKEIKFGLKCPECDKEQKWKLDVHFQVHSGYTYLLKIILSLI